jgi:hypothetical protein
MTIGVSSHGIIIARAPAATPTVFTDIAEIDASSLPEIFRNEFDASVQNRNIDDYVMGMLRRKSITLSLNFLQGNGSHDQLTGLYSALIGNTFDGYKTYQTSSGFIWVASGNVQSIAPKTPTDGTWGADVTLRFSGVMSLNGTTIGT